jgi:manganese/zinc/iron transport system ATP- binding protein
MKNPLCVKNLLVDYGFAPIVDNVTFTVPEGALAAIIGPNGAGKTTLLKALFGLIPAKKGTIRFWDKKWDEAKARVAYVPQKESVDWSFPMTSEELVLMGRYGRMGLFKWPKREDREKVEKALFEVGLQEMSKRPISELSWGQKQRLFIARALVQEPDFFIMDEPFQGIDMGSCHLILEILKGLQKKNKTLLIVHHDLYQVQRYFDWAILLNHELITSGSIEKVFCPECLSMAYGSNFFIIQEAMKKNGHREP